MLVPENLSKAIKEQILAAQNADTLYISSIALWEIAMLISKKRIDVFERTSDFLNSITDIDGLNIINLDADIAAESVTLHGEFHGDSADSLIVASTRKISGKLIISDQIIINWGKQGFIKIMVG